MIEASHSFSLFVPLACCTTNSFDKVEGSTPFHSAKEFLAIIPSSALFDQPTLAALLEHDPLVAEYRVFFASLDWSVIEAWQARERSGGRPAHPERAYLKAFLVRIKEGLSYTTQLRDFLVKHPLLAIELGFQLVFDPTQPYGFDVERTLPTRFWLGEKLRQLDRGLLTDLLWPPLCRP